MADAKKTTKLTKSNPGPSKSNGKKRSDFALPGKHFPLNTPGRVKAAPGLAARSEKAGNITKAQEQKVVKAAAKKSGK